MDNQELILKVFKLVKQELQRFYGDSMEYVKASEYEPVHCGACKNPEDSTQICTCEPITHEVNKNVISEGDVKHALGNNANEMLISSKAIVTCLAEEYAIKHNIAIVRKAQ